MNLDVLRRFSTLTNKCTCHVHWFPTSLLTALDSCYGGGSTRHSFDGIELEGSSVDSGQLPGLLIL
jgi:hypothetical protein